MSRGDIRENYRDNNRIIAGLLAFIAGTFGVHRFYLNDIGGGIFYIFLFFITIKFFPVTMILGIIEALKLFKMSPEEFDEKYNNKLSGKSRRFQGRNRPQVTRERTNGGRTRSRTNESRSQQRTQRRSTSLPKRNPFKTSGMEKYKDFDLEEAVIDFNKALKLADNDPEIYFYLAASYSLMEKKDLAYKNLELAVENGLKNPERIETFEDLAFVRIQDQFDDFKANGYKTLKSTEPAVESPNEEVLDDDVLLSQLNKLDELRKRGLISNEEFQIEKEKLIDHRK